MNTNIKYFFMMVGLPGCGKSTLVEQLYTEFPEKRIAVLSADSIIEKICELYRLDYNEVYSDISYSFCERVLTKIAPIVFNKNDIVVWDQTNLRKKGRAKRLALVPDSWKKIAIVVPVPYDHLERLANRPGKTIPESVIDKMYEQYEDPELDEGFDHIERL